MDAGSLTPLLKQYFQIKKQQPDSLLFFRLGDFYEMFFEDARIAAPILEVVLTSRNKNKEDAVPMCGVPYHALDNYAVKLLKKGFKVAICEQVEDPALAKGIVRREVTHVLTPATALEIEGLDSMLNNFVVAIVREDRAISLAAVDLAAADFEIKCFPASGLECFLNEFYRKSPREVVIARKFEPEFRQWINRFPEMENVVVNCLDDHEFSFFEAEATLKKQFNLETVEGLGMADYPSAVVAGGILLQYLQAVRKTALKNISQLRFVPEEDYLILDAVSFRNLEIITNLRTGTAKGSLLDAVDLTLTPMGKRLLKRWLSYPLLQRDAILKRLEGIEEFSQNLIGRSEVRKILKSITDLAKLNSKIALNVALPRHLQTLQQILERIPDIQRELTGMRSVVCREIVSGLDPLVEVAGLIGRAIDDDPASHIQEGNFIRKGFSTELDELRELSRNAKTIVAALEKDERAKTRIPSLKIRYNKVFGYFIEVTNTHLKLIPPHYIRKQTLVNTERFITEELKELEDKILKAEEKIIEIEKRLYREIISDIQGHSARLNQNAERLAVLDVLSSGGELAQRSHYCRPEIISENDLVIRDGRHPVLEANSAEKFIPNDLTLSAEGDQILIITGPNMGGKSTYLRQNALIVILAQAGFFVPAEKAQIGLCDRIFTRIGASDALIEGKSTFLVEMIEAAIILNNATTRSLVLLDEIGRGTSTFDGLSIAWAVIEYLHGLKQKPRTLFATHYHELTELSQVLERVKNYHISVREWQEHVIFLHKVLPGATDQSFGIHVAKIAGVPLPVIERAKEILLNLEKKELSRLVKERISGKIDRVTAVQPSLFPEEQELKVWDEIREKLRQIDTSQLTPLEALNILHFLKSRSDDLK